VICPVFRSLTPYECPPFGHPPCFLPCEGVFLPSVADMVPFGWFHRVSPPWKLTSVSYLVVAVLAFACKIVGFLPGSLICPTPFVPPPLIMSSPFARPAGCCLPCTCVTTTCWAVLAGAFPARCSLLPLLLPKNLKHAFGGPVPTRPQRTSINRILGIPF